MTVGTFIIKTIFQFEDGHGNHVEADTRAMVHVNHADKNGKSNIIVGSNEINIAIILTCHSNLLNSSPLWCEFYGVDYNTNRE